MAKLTVHDVLTLRAGGEIAWAVRKGSPQLKAALDDFVGRNKNGTSTWLDGRRARPPGRAAHLSH